jgi:hypothetical protein
MALPGNTPASAKTVGVTIAFRGHCTQDSLDHGNISLILYNSIGVMPQAFLLTANIGIPVFS